MIDIRELTQDPAKVAALAQEDAATLLVELASLQTALAVHLRTVSSKPEQGTLEVAKGRLLSPRVAAERLGVTVQWLYRHADDLPFTRRLGRKTLRFFEPGLERYIRQRSP